MVFADEDVAGGAAEGECSAIGIDVEPVTVDDVVGVFLRQTFGENLEALAAVARARDDERAVDGIAPLVLLARDEPCGSGLLGMHDDGEAEHRWLRLLDFRAREPAVRATEDAVVMLNPNVVGLRRALHDAMRVLRAALVRLVGRSVIGAHALALAVPRVAAVVGEPETAARDADSHDV